MTTTKSIINFRKISRFFSAESLTQKAYLTAIAATLDYGMLLLVGFVVTPFLVSGLGDVGYGIWRTLDGLTGYLSAASGRPSQALKSTIANLQGSVDYEEKRRNVASALIVWFLFFPLLTAIGGVLVWFAPIWINDLPASLYAIVRLTTALLVLRMIMVTLTELPRSVMEGVNLGYKRMGLTAVLTIIGGGLTLLALSLNTGLLGVAIASVATILLTGLLNLFLVRNYVPWFGLAKPSRQETRKFLGLSGWFLIWRLVIQSMSSSGLLILGFFASSELVTLYSLTNYVPETLLNFVAVLVFGSMPGLGGIIGSGDTKKAAQVRNELMLFTWLSIAVIGFTTLVWNQTFITLWVGSGRYAGSIATLLILVMVGQFVLIRNDANIIDLTLDLSHKVLLGLLSAVVSFVTGSLLVGYFHSGISGMVLGLIIGRSILSLTFPVLIGRFLGVSLASQLKGALRPALVTVVLVLLALALNQWINTSSSFMTSTWVGFLLAAGTTFVGVSALVFFLGLSGDQKNRVVRRVRMTMFATSP